MGSQVGSLGNKRQGYIVLPKGAVPDQNDTYRFMREIEISRSTRTESRNHWMSKRLEDLVTDRKQTLTKFDLHYHSHRSSECVPFRTILLRDSAQPWLLQVGTPRFDSSHCVKTTQATRNATPQNQSGMFTFSYLPTPSLRMNVIIGHQFVNPD